MLVNELIKKGALYFSDINVGFEEYNHEFIEGSREELYHMLQSKVEENGYENSYVDFYYNKLDEEARSKVDSSLTKEEIDYVLRIVDDSLYYPLDETLLAITFKLSADEILFSSFYFCKVPSTIWGNYGLRWPVFYKK